MLGYQIVRKWTDRNDFCQLLHNGLALAGAVEAVLLGTKTFRVKPT